jgi:nucleotide-binding universal stress UspA family protein
MFRRILIPLDGSPIADQALPLAKMFAVRFQSSVVLFQAIEFLGKRRPVQDTAADADDQLELSRTRALEYFETIERDFPGGLSVEHEVRVGSAATEILALAESAQVDLIVMVTHGSTGLQRWVYGSVADKVLSGSRLPILLVRASEAPHAMALTRRILVPLDGSALAERALAPALCLAKAFDAQVLLFRAQEPAPYVESAFGAGASEAALDEALGAMVEEYLTGQTRAVRSQGVRVSWVMKFGMAAEGILEVAQKHTVDVVVMSTHGRSGAGRWIMGSVADRVLRASQIPVLLIRSGAVVD